jgi:hypothetical protein
MARSMSGMTVSSYPQMPSKTFSLSLDLVDQVLAEFFFDGFGLVSGSFEFTKGFYLQ